VLATRVRCPGVERSSSIEAAPAATIQGSLAGVLGVAGPGLVGFIRMRSGRERRRLRGNDDRCEGSGVCIVGGVLGTMRAAPAGLARITLAVANRGTV